VSRDSAHTRAEQLSALIERDGDRFPYASDYLKMRLSTQSLREETMAQMVARAERHGELFWTTLDSAIRDAMALYEKQVPKEARDQITMGTMLMDIVNASRAMPHHHEHHSFDEVHSNFYAKTAYPFVEHMYYFGGHGIDRLARIVELVGTIEPDRVRRFADVGVGPAVVFCRLLDDHPDWQGDAFDVSEPCVEYARAVAALHGIAETRYRVLVGDGRALAVEDGTYDLIVATEVIEHVPDPEALLGELRRALAPEGLLLGSVPTQLPWGPHLASFADRDAVKQLFSDCGFACEHFLEEPFGKNASLTFGLYRPRS
jgi:SAM-dependent methyltransferase